MSIVPVNPRPMLSELVGKQTAVRLKFGEVEYRGELISFDNYFNLQMKDIREYIGSKYKGTLGEGLIRWAILLMAVTWY